MSAVVEQKTDPAARYDSEVGRQIAEATSRIRAHDLALGGLALACLVAGYATAMILLDKYLNLPEWVRQVALAGFVVAVAGTAYFLVARPLRRRINPLYAAAAVEKTIDDPKNSVTGYVEAQEKGEVPAVVKAAMSARAARAAGRADVNRAVDHRNLLIAGGVLVAFLLTLTALFFIFRPTQFSSLLGRAFVPFSSDPIATRTQLTLVKPEPPDATITSGQTVTVAVHVGGKVPAKGSPQRVRLLVRYNPADPNYEEIPLEEGDTSRDWQIKVPEDRVLNGFWYKVAAGDTETPEHRVTVRSLPHFTDEFEAKFKYPAYMRKPDDRTRHKDFAAYRGTKVTVIARADREVKDGSMAFDIPGLPRVTGKPVPNDPRALVFEFPVSAAFPPTEAGKPGVGYRLHLTTPGGERNPDPPTHRIRVEADRPPTVVITKPEAQPEDPELTLPANGQLAVDGVIGDDFGIDKARLVLTADGRPLAPVFAEGGKPLRSEKDGRWFRDYVFKGSVNLADPNLVFADGQKFEPKDGTVIEYWLEAIDNCTETPPQAGWGKEPQPGNVGRSPPRTVRLTPPLTGNEDRQNLDQKRQDRQDDEKRHADRQRQEFDQKNAEEDKKKDQQPKEGEPQKKDAQPGDKKDGEPKAVESDPKQPADPNNTDSGGKGGKTDSKTKDGEPQKKDGIPPPEGDPRANHKADPKQPGEPGDGTGMPQPKQDTKQPEGKQPEDGATGKSGEKTEGPKSEGTPPKGGTDPGTGGKQPDGTDQAPMPKGADEKKLEQDAERLREELNRNKSPEGDAKPNTAPNPDDRTDPGQPKPQPKDGNAANADSQPKPGPQPNDPANPMPKRGDRTENAPSESKPEGNLQNTEPSVSKPAPKDPDPKAAGTNEPGKKAQPPAERRDEPLGGAPGTEQPEPKKDGTPTDPKDQNRDPQSGSEGKPAGSPPQSKDGDPKGRPRDNGAREQPKDAAQPKSDPAADAGRSKPSPEQARGRDRDAATRKSDPDAKDKTDQPNAGEGKPQSSPPAAETKPGPTKDDPNADKDAPTSEAKPAPKDGEGMEPKGTNPGEARPEPKGGDNAREPGTDRKEQKDQQAGGRGESEDKKDAVGGKDGKGPKGGGGDAKDGKQPDPETLKKLQDAAQNLDNPDPNKKQEARDTLDKAIGEQNRKELEKLQKDLKSDDPKTRDAARKQVEDALKRANDAKRDEVAKKDGMKDGPGGEPKKDGDGTGKKLTPEEIAELAKKAGDLNSKDDAKRKEAEKAFDDKFGEEARKQLQEEMAKQPPKDPADPKEQQDLRDKLNDLTKNNPPGQSPAPGGDDIKGQGPGGSGELAKPLEDDPKNRAKTAQLQLEDFEKNRYNKELQDRLGWTQEDMDRFLKNWGDHVERLQQQADEADRNPPQPQPAPAGEPRFKIDSGGKVEPTTTGPKGAAGSGAVFAPPGFEEARKRFQQELDKAKPKK
jgi:hypothetical protein